jgi:peptidoglycan/LPS O-acetylase OafA/YrhL
MMPIPVKASMGERRPVPAAAGAATRFGGFDGLRAIAALSVFVYHISVADLRPLEHHYGRYLTLLNIGVPLFFVISGFLLYRPYVVARFDDRPRPSTREFLRRRVLRIIPGFWVALTVLCVIFNVNGSPYRSWKWAVVNYGLLQSFIETTAPPGLGLAWTIGTEMTFYLALPVYAWLLARNAPPPPRQRNRELIAIIVVVLFSIGWRVFFLSWSFPPSMRWYQAQVGNYLPANADYFAGGMLLAVLSAWFARNGAPRWTRSRLLAPAAWAVAFAAYAFYVEVVSQHSLGGRRSDLEAFSIHELFFVCVVCLALPAVFGEAGRGVIRRVLSSRPLQLVGLVSFGLYLYHQPAIKFVYDVTGAQRSFLTTVFPDGPDIPFVVMLLLCAIAALACATASYVFVESPFLRRKHRPHRVSGRSEDRSAYGTTSR